MRVAVISDIHGSFWALDAVLNALKHESPDLVVHGGDLALNGPRPAELVDLITERGFPGVVGNTDELLWKPEVRAEQEARMPKLRRLLYVLFEEAAVATRELLGAERLDWLRGLPTEWRINDLVVIHASPGDLWRAPRSDSDEQTFLDTYGSLGARVVVYGHIHRPFVRELAGFTVANSGSVGLTWDGDPRASYLLIDGRRAQVRRVEYDVERDVSDLFDIRYPYASWLAEMRQLGTYLPPPARV